MTDINETSKDPLMGDAPTPAEWCHPEITFDSPKSRGHFQHILMDKRDAIANVPDDAPEFTRESAQAQRDILDELLDRMGKATDDTAPVTFHTPAELNVAMMAANWVYAVINSQEGDNSDALDNIAEILTILVEGHWKDNEHIQQQLEGVHEAYQ